MNLYPYLYISMYLNMDLSYPNYLQTLRRARVPLPHDFRCAAQTLKVTIYLSTDLPTYLVTYLLRHPMGLESLPQLY